MLFCSVFKAPRSAAYPLRYVRDEQRRRQKKSFSPKGISSLVNFFLAFRLRTTEGTPHSLFVGIDSNLSIPLSWYLWNSPLHRSLIIYCLFDHLEVTFQIRGHSRISEDKTGVICRDDLHAVLFHYFASEQSDPFRWSENPLRCECSERAYDPGSYGIQLKVQIRFAGLDLITFRISIVRRPALNNICDVDLCFFDTHLLQKYS